MSDANQEQHEATQAADAEEPSTEDLEEPSTEKEPGEEPKAAEPHDPEPSHHAVGIGVVGGPQSIADELAEDTEQK